MAFNSVMALYLLFIAKGNTLANRTLAVFLIILLMENVNFLLHANGVTMKHPAAANVLNNFGVLLGTCVYLYAKALISPQDKTKYILHCTPAVVMTLINVIFYHSLATHEQIEILRGGDATWSRVIPWVVIAGHITILSYTVAAALMLRRNGLRLRQFLSDIESMELRWLRNIIAIFFIIWAIRFSIIPLSQLNVAQWLVAPIKNGYPVLILASVIVLVFQALKQHPALTRPEHRQGSTDLQKPTAISDPRYEIDCLQEQVNSKKLWRTPGLTIYAMADSVGMDEKRVSQLLNEYMKTNFFDFINHLRVKDAQEQLLQSNFSVIDICFATGFNSKTAFNRAFKRHLNMTPSHLRKSLR